MRRFLAACTLLTLAACSEPGADVCAQRAESYHIVITVTLPEPTKAADEVTHGRVLATVFEEENSILSCDGTLVSTQTPGQSLLSDVPVYVDAAGFTLDVDATVYPEIHTPQLTLSLLFDENGNGRCDDGEPQGNAPIERVAHSKISLNLAPRNCALRL